MSSSQRSARIRGHSSHNLVVGHALPEKPHELTADYFSGTTDFSTHNGLQLSGRAGSVSMGNLESSLSSYSSSGTMTGDRRSFSLSHSGSQGWTSGTGSELSYDDVTEFDRQASAKVKCMFDDIDNVLYGGSSAAVKWQMPTTSECTQWKTRFPHLRIVGSSIKDPYDPDDEAELLTNMCHYPPPLTRTQFNEPFLEDVTAEEASDLMSPSPPDARKLQIQGRRIRPKPLPEPGSEEWDDALYDEVIAENGNYEEYVMFDSSEIEATPKKDLSYRGRRLGLPPVTPNACVRDTAVSQLFDRSWSDILLALRPLLELYKMKVLAKDDFHPVDNTPTPTPHDVFSHTERTDQLPGGFNRVLAGNTVAQLRFRTLSYGGSSQSSGIVGNVTDLQQVMTIRPFTLRQRQSSGLHNVLESREGTPLLGARDPDSTVRLGRLGTGHLVSRVSDHQLPSNAMRPFTTVKPKRAQTLKPIERAKTPGCMDDLEVLRGHRLQMGTERVGTPATPSWGGRNHPLPPIENANGRTEQSEHSPPQRKSSPKSRVKFASRIQSAAEMIEVNRFFNLKILGPENRPYTTHASRSEFDMSLKPTTRRSSTPHTNAALTVHPPRHGVAMSGSSPHKGLTGMSLHPQMRDSAYHRSTISQHGVSAGLGGMLLSEEEDETDGTATMWTGHTQGQQSHVPSGRKQRSTLR